MNYKKGLSCTLVDGIKVKINAEFPFSISGRLIKQALFSISNYFHKRKMQGRRNVNYLEFYCLKDLGIYYNSNKCLRSNFSLNLVGLNPYVLICSGGPDIHCNCITLCNIESYLIYIESVYSLSN